MSPTIARAWATLQARHGVLARLRDRPMDAAALASALGIDPDQADALGAWLDLGASAGLLRKDGTRYALRGIAKPLALASHDPVAAFYTELVELEYPLVTEAIDRLRQRRPFVISDADADLIARTSRMSEAPIAALLEQVVPAHGPVRLVEVGCGSGAHIRAAAAVNPQLTALGVELQEPAADQARANLAAWGLSDRVMVQVGDVRDATGTADADVVTLHQNIYYFPQAERAELLRHLGGFLRPGGRLVVTTIARDTGHASAGLDLWCALTEGADRLPTAASLEADARAAGYTDVEALPLMSGGMYVGLVATWPGSLGADAAER